MIERIARAARAHGDKAVVVPISRLDDLRRDIADLRRANVLNDYQRHIVERIYGFDIPEEGLVVRSIVIVATPSPAATITLAHRGRSIPVAIPPGYVGHVSAPIAAERYLNEALAPLGYRVHRATRLPHKLLAVRSGLGVYGRNNLCYVEGMGSLLNLTTFFCDGLCLEGTWHPVRAMDACDGCAACRDACPTGAILRDRFLIDNTRCLTCLNEAGREYDGFSEWVPPSAHHAAYGCSRCTQACPQNRAYIGRPGVEVTVAEEATALFLQGLSVDELPAELQAKVNALDMAGFLGALPRNLRALGMSVE
ncbi:MAG TPA: 4Fe-4S binding protein [Chloroflexi bacterium]|jgi:epoxyqueuosine reductase|nr:4Fe-4S binding protein [Chloroflexota bacterium]